MEISRQTKKHMIQIIAFAILLYCGIQNFSVVVKAISFIFGILMPFIVGAAIAFILNVPMKKIESRLFQKNKKLKRFRRPVAYILTLLCVIGIIALALLVVIPELADTITILVSQIPKAFGIVQKELEGIAKEWPALEPALSEMDIDWSSLSASAVSFVKGLATGLVTSGFGLFSGIVSGVTSFFISFVFSIYILLQKEKLNRQIRQILYALLPEKVTEKIISIAQLSGQIFSSFLSGQCLEAVILGCMFFVTMTIFRMPYAMLIGIVIAITALIPIFGAFIGCGVGVFLIVMVNPVQALWFLVLFLVLQQIEGNLIYPKVVGGSIGLPSIWVLVAVSVGGDLFGIIGILIFIPLCSVIYALMRDFVKKRLKQRGITEAKWSGKPVLSKQQNEQKK